MRCAIVRVVSGDLEIGVLPAPGESLPGFEGNLNRPATVVVAGSHPHLIREVRMEIKEEQIVLVPDESGSPDNLLICASKDDAAHLYIQGGREIAVGDRTVLILMENVREVLVHKDRGSLCILPSA